MLRLAVCDDNHSDLTHVLTLLGEYGQERNPPALVPFPFSSCARLLEATDETQPFDLYILDVVMAGENGIDAAKQLRRAGILAPIIYVTSSSAYALDAWRVHALRYLLKPVLREDLFEAMDAFLAESRYRVPTFFTVKTPEGLVQLRSARIVSVQNILHTVEYTVAGEEPPIRSTTHREPFLEIAAPLLALPQFVQTHKSYLINFDQVKFYQPREFVMSNDQVIPISPKYAAVVRKAYLAYFDGNRVL